MLDRTQSLCEIRAGGEGRDAVRDRPARDAWLRRDDGPQVEPLLEQDLRALDGQGFGADQDAAGCRSLQGLRAPVHRLRPSPLRRLPLVGPVINGPPGPIRRTTDVLSQHSARQLIERRPASLDPFPRLPRAAGRRSPEGVAGRGPKVAARSQSAPNRIAARAHGPCRRVADGTMAVRRGAVRHSLPSACGRRYRAPPRRALPGRPRR